MNYKMLFPTYRARYLFVRDQLERLGGVQKSKRMLSLGCGEGDNDRLLAAYTEELHACDVNEDDVVFAATLNADLSNVRYGVENGERLTYPDGYFDTVVCLEVIEHVEHPERLVSQIARVLAPSGHLVLTCPSEAFPVTYDPINTFLRRTGKTLPIGAYGYGHSWLVRHDQILDWLGTRGLDVLSSHRLSRHAAGLFECYLPGVMQKLLKANAGNRASTEKRARTLSPGAEEPPFVGLVDAFVNFDERLFAGSLRSVGLGYVCRK